MQLVSGGRCPLEIQAVAKSSRGATSGAYELSAACFWLRIEAGAPRLNQPGKDVHWVPTPLPLVDRMLDMAQLTPQDRLVDLGSGDGVLVIAAARRGTRAWGIEYDRGLVEYAKRKAREAGVAD